MSKYLSDPDQGQPNPVVNAASNLVAHMRADEDMLAVAKCFDELGPKAIEKLSPQEARLQPTPADAVNRLLTQQGKSTDPHVLVPGIEDREIGVLGATGPLAARCYKPEGTGPFPVILYFHGGGWVIADKEVYDASARCLAKLANAVVVSIDYRRAPEDKFPAAWDDCLAAYRWLCTNADAVHGDASRLALAGESAGGNLAVATAVAARDAGLPAPVHVLAVYPVAQTSMNTESYLENAIAKPLNRAMMGWFFEHVTRTEADLKDPRLCLVDADLAGLPPVTIINAALDPLRSDGAQLEQALQRAGVAVERKTYSGVAHEFFGAGAVLRKASEAQAYAAARLQACFGR